MRNIISALFLLLVVLLSQHCSAGSEQLFTLPGVELGDSYTEVVKAMDKEGYGVTIKPDRVVALCPPISEDMGHTLICFLDATHNVEHIESIFFLLNKDENSYKELETYATSLCIRFYGFPDKNTKEIRRDPDSIRKTWFFKDCRVVLETHTILNKYPAVSVVVVK